MKKYSDPIHDAKMTELCLDCRHPFGEHHWTGLCPKWVKVDGTQRCYEFKATTFIPSGDYEEENVSSEEKKS